MITSDKGYWMSWEHSSAWIIVGRHVTTLVWSFLLSHCRRTCRGWHGAKQTQSEVCKLTAVVFLRLEAQSWVLQVVWFLWSLRRFWVQQVSVLIRVGGTNNVSYVVIYFYVTSKVLYKCSYYFHNASTFFGLINLQSHRIIS